MSRKKPDGKPAEAPKRIVVLQNMFSPLAVRGLAREVLKHLGERSEPDHPAPRAAILTLCRALRAPHPYAAQAQVDRLFTDGMAIDLIYRRYLAAAAVELGRQWEDSEMSFAEVTIALARIHAILDDLRTRLSAPPTNRLRRIAFAAVPGEQRRLGVEMATDLFRREGWDVDHLIESDHHALVSRLDDTDIVLLGLSVATKASMAALVRLILSLRARRPDLSILVSGRLAGERARDLETLGVDAVVTDVPEALRAVADLVGKPSGQTTTW